MRIKSLVTCTVFDFVLVFMVAGLGSVLSLSQSTWCLGSDNGPSIQVEGGVLHGGRVGADG